MAVWQFSLHLLPRPKLVEFFGEIPACVDRDMWESADLEHWDTHALADDGTSLLDEVLPRMQGHWCETVTAWGSYDGNIAEVSFEGARIEWFHVRIDLRESLPQFSLAICQIGSMSDCYLLTEDMRLIEPRMELLTHAIQQSNAYRFVSDPKGFLDSFHGMPRLDSTTCGTVRGEGSRICARVQESEAVEMFALAQVIFTPRVEISDSPRPASTTSMRLWTVQPLVVWEQLQQLGLLRVDETRLSTPGYVPDSYRWLARQLEQRLPDYPGTLPWWAYCEKPDLRWVRHRQPSGQREVRLELEPCPGTFLTVPSWAWDTVFCGQYLSFAQQEHDEWMEAMRHAVPDKHERRLSEPWRAQLEASWLRLFDRNLPPRPWADESMGKSGSREAALGALRLEEVRQVTHFVGCNKWGRRG